MRPRIDGTSSEQGVVVVLFLTATACGVLAATMSIISTGPSYVVMALMLLAALTLLFVGGMRWQKVNIPKE